MIPQRKLVVFAEFTGAYLWVKPANDYTSQVGANIGGTSYPLAEKYGISVALQADFQAWISKWEITVLPRVEYKYEEIAPRAFWTEIYEEGLSLARRLKAEVGDQFEVEYNPTWEDPEKDAPDGLIIGILSDGSLQTYQPTASNP